MSAIPEILTFKSNLFLWFLFFFFFFCFFCLFAPLQSCHKTKICNGKLFKFGTQLKEYKVRLGTKFILHTSKIGRVITNFPQVNDIDMLSHLHGQTTYHNKQLKTGKWKV